MQKRSGSNPFVYDLATKSVLADKYKKHFIRKIQTRYFQKINTHTSSIFNTCFEKKISVSSENIFVRDFSKAAAFQFERSPNWAARSVLSFSVADVLRRACGSKDGLWSISCFNVSCFFFNIPAGEFFKRLGETLTEDCGLCGPFVVIGRKSLLRVKIHLFERFSSSLRAPMPIRDRHHRAQLADELPLRSDSSFKCR